MKQQGKATHSSGGSTKVEPSAKVVPPAFAGRMGMQHGNHASDHGTINNLQKVPMYAGRGLEAPMAGSKIHKSGSQGHHK